MKALLPRVLVLTAALAVPVSASADLVVTLQPETPTLVVGDSSYFDVFVTGATSASDAVGAYNITLLEESGIDYTGITTATSAPDDYIFSDANGLTTDSTATDAAYADVSASGPTNISNDETFGAGRVSFTAVAAGTYTINFATPIRSSFIDANTAAAIPATFTGATINVAAVPEPTTTLLLGLLAVVACGVVWRRRACAAPIAARG